MDFYTYCRYNISMDITIGSRNMNIWVEWFRFEDTNDTWAQMREQPKWNPPPSTEIQRRFFDKHEDADKFAKRKNDEGYHATIKTDRGR